MAPKRTVSTGGSSTSRIKKPKGTQSLTLGSGQRTRKISQAQKSGTRKVVGAIAAITPVGRVAKRLNNPSNRAPFLGSRTEELKSAVKTKIMKKTGGTYTHPLRGAKAMRPKSKNK